MFEMVRARGIPRSFLLRGEEHIAELPSTASGPLNGLTVTY